MIDEFAELEKLVNTRFENDTNLIDTCTNYAIKNDGLPWADNNDVPVKYAVYNYFSDKAKSETRKIIAFIETVISTAGSNDRRIADITTIYVKLATLKKRFNSNISEYTYRLITYRTQNLENVYSAYHLIKDLLVELFEKVRSTYGYLLPAETIKEYDVRSIWPKWLVEGFKEAHSTGFKDYTDNILHEIDQQPTAPDKMLLVINHITDNRELLLSAEVKVKITDENQVDFYGLPDYLKRIKWLEVQLEHIKNTSQIVVLDNTTPKAKKLKHDITQSKTTSGKLVRYKTYVSTYEYYRDTEKKTVKDCYKLTIEKHGISEKTLERAIKEIPS